MPIQPQVTSTNVPAPQSGRDINQKTNPKQVIDNSGFRPRTDVSVRSAITGLSKVLAEITNTQTSTLEDMPPELQKLVQNILKNSFSLEKTLNKGMGETIQAQRYVVDQLTTLGKLLTQLGQLAENNNFTGLPADLKLLLTQFRSLLSQNPQMTDTVNLLKTAFNLLNNKNPTDLSPDLQLLLNNSSDATTLVSSNQQNLLTLKNILNNLFTIKTTAAEDGETDLQTGKTITDNQSANTTASDTKKAVKNSASSELSNNPANSAATKNTMTDHLTGKTTINGQNDTASTSATTETAAKNVTNNELPANTANSAAAKSAMGDSQTGKTPVNSQNNTATTTPTTPSAAKNTASNESAANTTNSATTKSVMPDSAAGKTAVSSQNNTATTVATTQSTAKNISSAELSNNTTNYTAVKSGEIDSLPGKTTDNTNSTTAAQTDTKNSAKMILNINNNLQSMQALKELSGLIQKNTALTTADTALLKNFINNDKMSVENFQQLQKTMQIINNNLPGIILQTASKQQLPNLAKLWAFIQLSDISTVNTTHAEVLKQSGKDIEDFAKVMQRSFSHETAASSRQKSLDFILPLFLDDKTTYPTYLNIYNEDHKNPRTGEDEYETWFRVCCLTENAGAVEIVLRLYNKNDLNVRLAFSHKDTALSFEDYLPSLRSYLHDAKLSLTELKIDAID